MSFVDLDVTLRVPAAPDDEREQQLIDAAVAGGVSALVVSVSGQRVSDGQSARALAGLVARGREAGVTVIPAIAPLSVEGQLTDVALAERGLAELGVSVRVWRVARPTADTLALRRVGDLAAARGAIVIVSGLDAALADGAVAFEGTIATRLGLPAMPACAEAIGVARIVELARLTGARFHVAGVCTAAGAALVEAAAHDGVSGSVDASHLLLDETALRARPYDTRLLRSPPLPTSAARAALREAVQRGALMVASGHRAVRQRDRDLEFVRAAAGGSSLRSAARLLTSLLGPDVLNRAYGAAPAALLSLPPPQPLQPSAIGAPVGGHDDDLSHILTEVRA